MFFSLCASLNDEVSQCVRRSGEDSGVTLRKAVLHLTQVPSAACGHAPHGSPERTLSGSISDPRKDHVFNPVSPLPRGSERISHANRWMYAAIKIPPSLQTWTF